MAFDIKNFESIYGRDLLSHATFADNDIIAFNSLRDIKLNDKVRIGNFIIAICTGGKGMLTINGRSHAVEAGDLVICRPNNILGGLREESGFDCSFLCVSKEFVRNVMLLSGNWGLITALEENPVIHLSSDEFEVMRAYAVLLHHTIHGTPRPHHKETLDAQLRAAVCSLTDILFPHISPDQHTFYKAEDEFTKFLDIVSSTYPRIRKVRPYSQKLGLTNRKLATICLNACGMTAMQIINEYAVRDIKRDLLNPAKSVKQVAIEQGFKNMSTMGRYFKTYTGMSPRGFRSEYLSDTFSGEKSGGNA